MTTAMRRTTTGSSMRRTIGLVVVFVLVTAASFAVASAVIGYLNT